MPPRPAQPGPAGETAAAAAHDTTLSVFAAPAVQTGEAPSPAPIPSENAAENGYNYKEVLYDEDGLLVARIVGKRWSGYIAVIDDPMRVQVSVCPVFSPDMRGYSVAEHAEKTPARCSPSTAAALRTPAVPAKGAMPIGNVVANGESFSGAAIPPLSAWTAPASSMWESLRRPVRGDGTAVGLSTARHL